MLNSWGNTGGKGSYGFQPLVMGQLLGLNIELFHGFRFFLQKRQFHLGTAMGPAGTDQKDQKQNGPSRHQSAGHGHLNRHDPEGTGAFVKIVGKPHGKTTVGIPRRRKDQKPRCIVFLASVESNGGLLVLLGVQKQLQAGVLSGGTLNHPVNADSLRGPVKEKLPGIVQQKDPVPEPPASHYYRQWAQMGSAFRENVYCRFASQL